MNGNPSHFEAIGSRLGFRVIQENSERLVLVWEGARFPAFLCLGIALALTFISIPILQALRQRGFEGPAVSLWYFPLMNLILLGIAAYLLSVKRTIAVDCVGRAVTLTKRSLLRTIKLRLGYDDIAALRLGSDEVYSGFALAGSSAAETYSVPSLRLVLKNQETVLLDRNGMKKLKAIAERLRDFTDKPLEFESADSVSQNSAMAISDTAPGAVD
jgi:hypothetical protein